MFKIRLIEVGVSNGEFTLNLPSRERREVLSIQCMKGVGYCVVVKVRGQNNPLFETKFKVPKRGKPIEEVIV